MGSGYDVTTPSGADQEVFEAARRLESPDERLALVRRMCGGDAGAEARIVALLRAHDAAGRFLESTPPEIANLAGAAHSTLVESPGDEIGPYKLLQEIGHGGMGVVYMAEQCRPVRRRVALKIIKPGMDSREVVARFEAERQAMAMMDHAHIAKVLDAGTTASGRPFFVMELVKGIPINRYCDEQRLSLRERLELFVPVCQAVQHAHQKGIIHRDLKPSNILVALYDGRPVPKVIDFGVAKATSQKLTDKTMFTHFGQVVGTLEYMSPEQASVNQLDIDTRSDVYALGVVLYELLTGTTPLDRQRLASLAFDELMRIIRSEDPPRPSMRISSTNTSPETAACRQLDLKKLNLLLRGELDWIVMKALEKDRNRRYESANGLAADLQRYLNDEPVTACPPSASYRFRKFARRNKVALATAGTVAVALIAGTAVSAWQAVRATRAEVRARANESRALAEETRARRAEAKALAAADAERTAKQAESAQREQAEINFKLALDAVDRSFVQISENPRLQAHGLELLRRDLLQTSKEFYEQFITQRRQDPELRRELGQAYLRLADIHQALGEPAEAVSLYELARNVREELLRENPANANLERDLAQSLTLLGETLHELRQYDEAEKIFARALQIQEKLAQRAPHDLTLQSYVAGTVYAIGHVYLQTNRLNEALECFTRSRHLAVQLREQAPEKGTDYV
ncbi:MAG: protein kinase, partial [Pirellulaceae bacterium]